MKRRKRRPALPSPIPKVLPRNAILELNLHREVGIWETVAWGKEGPASQEGSWIGGRA